MTTLTDLSPLLLITTPVRVLSFRFCILDSRSSNTFGKMSLALSHNRLNSRNIATDIDDGLGVFELLRNGLRPQIKQSPLQLLELRGEFIGAHFAIILRFHFNVPVYSVCLLFINLHFIGILWATLSSACFATSSSTPPISKQTWPGLTLATQKAGSPLPLPMRVSRGLPLTDL